jgi:uncharacterized membrane protein
MLLRDRLPLSLLPAIQASIKVLYQSVSASLGFGRLSALWKTSLIVWVLVMVLTPIGLWIAGEGLFPALATSGVLAQAVVVLLSLAITWSFSRVVTIAAIVLLATWSVEALGSATGFPFGDYTYTSVLLPQSGGVPWLISIAWLMMLPPAWAVSATLLEGIQPRYRRVSWLLFAAISGIAFTAWDLYLDPQMVAWGLWVWKNPGGYFGIPWINFAGWWLTASALTWLIRPQQLSRLPLLTIYTLTWAFQAVGLGLFWGQPGPALAGFLGMGFFVFSSWFVELRRWMRSF